MGVVNSFNILVHECDCFLVCGSHPRWLSRELNILHYFQVCLPGLGQLTCWTSSYNNSYFSKRGSRWLLYLPFQLFILVLSSKEISQLSLSNEIFNLLFQIVAFIHVMPMVPMEAAILVPIALVGISLHFLRPFQRRIVLICIRTCSSGVFKGVYCWFRTGGPACYLDLSFLPSVPSLDKGLARNDDWGFLLFFQISSFSQL